MKKPCSTWWPGSRSRSGSIPASLVPQASDDNPDMGVAMRGVTHEDRLVDFFYISMPEIEDIGDGSQDALPVRVAAMWSFVSSVRRTERHCTRARRPTHERGRRPTG